MNESQVLSCRRQMQNPLPPNGNLLVNSSYIRYTSGIQDSDEGTRKNNPHHSGHMDEYQHQQCSCDLTHIKAELDTLRNETKIALERSWKEAGSMQEECFMKALYLRKLKFELGASKERVNIAAEYLACLLKEEEGKHEEGLRVDSSQCNLGATKKKGRGSIKLPAAVRSTLILGRKKEELKDRADLLLKLRSRDLTIATMQYSLKESRGMIEYLQNNRYVELE